MRIVIDSTMAVNGKVEIRPMMHVAFSYGHRIINGYESVGFVSKSKRNVRELGSYFIQR